MPLLGLGDLYCEVMTGLVVSSLLVCRARWRSRAELDPQKAEIPEAEVAASGQRLRAASGLDAAGQDGFHTTLTRLMLPDDANPAGNVHGGTILKMMELSAFIIAARHVNDADRSRVGVVLASIQHCSFLKPMKISL